MIQKKSASLQAASAPEGSTAGPPGKRRLLTAMRQLLEAKDFESITSAEIAAAAKANEALIYRYFGNKRGLMHQVLGEYLAEMNSRISEDITELNDPLERLAKIILDTFEIYARYPVFGKILLLEARSYPGYFESDSYQMVRKYARLIVTTVQEAINTRQFRSDIKAVWVRDTILGMTEQMVVPTILFDRPIDPAECTRAVWEVVVKGAQLAETKEPGIKCKN